MSGIPSSLVQMFPLLLVAVIFYFFLIRPQQQKAKAHNQMLGALKAGDNILTQGGILAQITKVINEQELQIEIAEGVSIRIMRSMIQQLIQPSNNKTTRTNKISTKSAKKKMKNA